jgi:hypothetical protein
MTTLIDPHTLITYSLAALILALTPGPGQALVMAYTVKGGRNHGVLAALGLEFGTLTHTVVAALGLSAILAISALAFTIVKLPALCFDGSAFIFGQEDGRKSSHSRNRLRVKCMAETPSCSNTTASSVACVIK